MKPILNNSSVNSSLTVTEPQDNHQIESQQIELRAYQLYEQRGRNHGHDIEDWLQAETEIRMQQSALPPIKSIAA